MSWNPVADAIRCDRATHEVSWNPVADAIRCDHLALSAMEPSADALRCGTDLTALGTDVTQRTRGPVHSGQMHGVEPH